MKKHAKKYKRESGRSLFEDTPHQRRSYGSNSKKQTDSVTISNKSYYKKIDLSLRYFCWFMCCLPCCSAVTVEQGEVGLLHTLSGSLIALQPGIHPITPCFERVQRITTKDIRVQLPKFDIFTTDQVPFIIKAQAMYRIVDPRKFTLSIENGEKNIPKILEGILSSTLRRLTSADMMPGARGNSNIYHKKPKHNQNELIDISSDDMDNNQEEEDYFNEKDVTHIHTGQQSKKDIWNITKSVQKEMEYYGDRWGITILLMQITDVDTPNNQQYSKAQLTQRLQVAKAMANKQTVKINTMADRQAAIINAETKQKAALIDAETKQKTTIINAQTQQKKEIVAVDTESKIYNRRVQIYGETLAKNLTIMGAKERMYSKCNSVFFTPPNNDNRQLNEQIIAQKIAQKVNDNDNQLNL